MFCFLNHKRLLTPVVNVFCRLSCFKIYFPSLRLVPSNYTAVIKTKKIETLESAIAFENIAITFLLIYKISSLFIANLPIVYCFGRDVHISCVHLLSDVRIFVQDLDLSFPQVLFNLSRQFFPNILCGILSEHYRSGDFQQLIHILNVKTSGGLVIRQKSQMAAANKSCPTFF